MSPDVGPLDALSLLFVPGDRPERFSKAVSPGADCIIIDLEDAVAPDVKSAALAHALAPLDSGERAVVRVNRVGTQWHDDEVAALAGTHAVLMVPKSHAVDDLARITERLGAERVIALIGTAVGVRDADAVCAAPGVVRVALGYVDLSAELGVDPTSHRAPSYARGRLIMASSAAGLPAPIDGVTTTLDAADALATDVEMTRELGFGGKLCIHPRQVEPVNAGLRHSEAEIEWPDA